LNWLPMIQDMVGPIIPPLTGRSTSEPVKRSMSSTWA
jgi:hypothetical protein